MRRAQMKYVGLDVHAAHCDICVVDDDGQVIFETSCTTNGSELVKVLAVIAEPKVAVLEETTLADWVYRVLQPHVGRVVVSDPRQNALIAKDENLNDKTAALKLALLLRAGFIHEVHHGTFERHDFKRLVLFYHKQTRTLIRLRNQLKAVFRSDAIACPGSRVYAADKREEWLAKLTSASAQFEARELLASIEYLAQSKARTYRQLTCRARQFPLIKTFQQVPGIGLVRAATYFAIVDTPQRFARKSKLWAYCGIGIARRSSGDSAGPEHLNRNGNPLLKDVVKGAATAAISTTGRFEAQYARLLAEHVSPEHARLIIARSLVGTLDAMWRKGQPYQPGYRWVSQPTEVAARA
jgi:transposase